MLFFKDMHIKIGIIIFLKIQPVMFVLKRRVNTMSRSNAKLCRTTVAHNHQRTPAVKNQSRWTLLKTVSSWHQRDFCHFLGPLGVRRRYRPSSTSWSRTKKQNLLCPCSWIRCSHLLHHKFQSSPQHGIRSCKVLWASLLKIICQSASHSLLPFHLQQKQTFRCCHQ